jgi:hypothetical protein
MIYEVVKLNRADLKSASTKEKITQIFSESLRKWKEEVPRKDKGEKLFYCPSCSLTMTETYYRLKRYGKPKCLTCGGIEMVEFDAQRWRELRQKLVDEALQIVPQVVEALLKVAEVHGILDGTEAVVEYGHVLRINPDHTPNNFRYDASTRRLEAYYYYYDLQQHAESFKELMKAAYRLGLGILVRIYPNHMRMPLPHIGLPSRYDIFNGHEIKMTAEELRGFAWGRGLL